MRQLIAVLLVLAGLASAAGVASGDAAPSLASAPAVCADFPNQAAAQRAANTIDADGDGIYCESLACPCLRPGVPEPPLPTATPVPTVTPLPTPVPTATPVATPTPVPTATPAPASCQRPAGVQSIRFSKTKYPAVRRHVERALRKGWPKVLVVNHADAEARRERGLQDHPARAGKERHEYPPADGRGRGAGLTKGTNPRGWKAEVGYVPRSEHRSFHSALGAELGGLCDGTKFRYVF